MGVGSTRRGIKRGRTVALYEKCEEVGIDPFMAMLFFAKGDWKRLGYDAPTTLKIIKGDAVRVDVIPPELRMNALAEVCQYLYPKRKAVEHGLDEDTPIHTLIDLVKSAAANESKPE